MECNLLYVYGILKRGYAADLSKMGAKFISEATMQNSQLYWIGKDRMGVGLRFEQDKGPAQGEIWEIPESLWSYLDDIEGVKYNVYKRILTYPLLVKIEVAVQAYVYAHIYYENEAKKYYNDPIPNNCF